MRMKLRRLIAALLISMLIFTVIGCGSNTGSAPSEEKATSQGQSTEENAKRRAFCKCILVKGK